MSVSIENDAAPLPTNDDEEDHTEYLSEIKDEMADSQNSAAEQEVSEQRPASKLENGEAATAGGPGKNADFINDEDSNNEYTSDSDDEPDVITGQSGGNQVNLFPGQQKQPEKPQNIQVPKDVGTIVKPTQGKAPDVRVQGDSAHTIYDQATIDEEKPWLQPGADVSDYFNYGFDEESWRIYCERQRMIRAGLDPLSSKHIMQRQKRPNYADKDPEPIRKEPEQQPIALQKPAATEQQQQMAANKALQEAAQAAAMQAIMGGQLPGMPQLPGMQLPGMAGLPGLPGMPQLPGMPVPNNGAAAAAAAALPNLANLVPEQPKEPQTQPPASKKIDVRDYDRENYDSARRDYESRKRDRSPVDRRERDMSRYDRDPHYDRRDYHGRDPHGRSESYRRDPKYDDVRTKREAHDDGYGRREDYDRRRAEERYMRERYHARERR